MRRAVGEEFRHAGLAMMAAKKFHIAGWELDDLFQVACEGIVAAMPRYDASKGRESTFAYRCAHNAVLRELRRTAVAKRVPQEMLLSLSCKYRVYRSSGEYDELGDLLEAPGADPALIVEQRDTLRRALGHPSLTAAERACLVATAVGAEESEVGYTHTTSSNARRKLRRAA